MIAIIDYGAGNIQSVYKALRHIGADCVVTRDYNEIIGADGAVLPGVGAFGDCMENMESTGAKQAALDFIKTGKPFLGICLGLQLLFPESEENEGVNGLSVLNGKIKRIPSGEGLKIPHMGWNNIEILKHDGIFEGIENSPYVYFVHSYYLDADDKDIVSAQTEYGVKIDAAVSYKNVTATQFHPEKSGETGLRMLKNFVRMCE